MHERKLSKPENLPLISLGFVILALLVFFNVQIQFRNELREARNNFADAIDFATKNPGLKITPRFAQVIKSENATYTTDDTFSFLMESREENPDLVGTTKQEKFNLFVAKAFGNLDLHPTRTLGIVPQQTSLVSYLTYPFVHAGVIHFFATMLLILLLAPQIETLWKLKFFLPVLVITSVLAGVAAQLAQPDLDRAHFGGSSIVSLLTGAVLLRFWLQPVRPFAWLEILPPLADTTLASLSMPSWTLGIAWLFYMAILPWAMQAGFPTGVEHSAGYVANAVALALGAGAAFAAKKFAFEHTLLAARSVQHRKESVDRLDLATIRKLREAGNDEQAFNLLVQETQNGVARRDIVLLFWEMAVERAQAEQAAPALHALIKEEVRRGGAAHAVELWLQLAKHAPQRLLEPGLLVHLFASIRSSDGGDKAALLALKHALHRSNPSPLSAALATQIAQLASELDPQVAQVAIERALGTADLSDEMRAQLDALQAQLAPKSKTPSTKAAPQTPSAAKKLPPAPFAEDEDRSLFGNSADLGATDDNEETHADTHAHRAELFTHGAEHGLEAAPLDAMLGSDTTQESDMPGMSNYDDAQDCASEEIADDYAPPPPPQISSYGQDPIFFELATPKSDRMADGATTEEAGRNLDCWLVEIGMAPPQAVASLPPDFTQFMAPPTKSAGSRAATPPSRSATPAPTSPSAPSPAPMERPIFSRVLVKSIVPITLEKEGLLVQGSDGQPTRLGYARIQAIALAAVAGLVPSGKSILVIDLLLNWQSGGSTALQTVRLRSDQFDPRKLCPQSASPLQAVFDLVTFLRAQSNATVLVGLEQPGKVPTFASLALYTKQVLGVESESA